MNTIENEFYKVVLSDGIITGLYEKDKGNCNIVDKRGLTGTISYTKTEEKLQHLFNCSPYDEKKCKYDEIIFGTNEISCIDTNMNINTVYFLGDDGIHIKSCSDNSSISQFAINLDFNFLGKIGYKYNNQILPTSPYISLNGEFCYCIMTRPNGRFIVVTSLGKCVGFRNLYSSYSAGHYITGFQFFSDFDKEYAISNNKNIHICISFAESLEHAYKIVKECYDVPMCINIVNGTFDKNAMVKLSHDTDEIRVKKIDDNSKTTETICLTKEAFNNIIIDEYGLYAVTPYSKGKKGIESIIWNGNNINLLFDKCCESIKKPYHNDQNLCEGGCFLWAMLINMRLHNHRKYDIVAINELNNIMGKNGVAIKRRTILPYKTDKYHAYHICESKRVQEQFFGVSILLEAYKLYNKEEYLEYATLSLMELVENFMTDEGMIYNGSDYTTVCAPVITIVDMANFLKEKKDERYIMFQNAAIKVADFLIKRGFDFPTEGEISNEVEKEMEDGSISCTALSVLYVCKNLKYDIKYINFAKKILNLHNAWTIYTPDARMFQSSFRWWETIWEGDGEGPAVCAGHAWTIWRAEALYLLGILTIDDDAMVNSWNGFITNFAKTDNDGTMYSCFEVDHIRGGGIKEIKENLAQLKGEDLSIKRVIGHGYPKHADNSLSRYAWIRAAYSWLHTAAIVSIGEKVFGINIKQQDEQWIAEDYIEDIFIGNINDGLEIVCNHDVKIYKSAETELVINRRDKVI